MAISKVLIANRGEIAVRIARACKDHGIVSVAVYAEPDRDALHVKVADGGLCAGWEHTGRLYLLQDKLIEVAKQARADAVHPGYGFLAENGPFAQKVIDAGLVWIGPGPEAIDSLGDKVKARPSPSRPPRRSCRAPRTPSRVLTRSSPSPKEHGLPVAIKAAYGGGGRGLKVARTLEEIPELFDSAVREAVTAFGRGECFVERSSTTRATSRPSAWPTSTATSLSCRRATARCSGATRSSSRRRRPLPPPTPSTTGWCAPQGDPQGGRVRRRRHLRSTSSAPTGHLLPRSTPPPGRAPRLRGGHRHRPGA